MTNTITREEVVEYGKRLPAFPLVIKQTLETLDDPESNLHVLIDFVERDPVIESQVLSLANRVATRTRNIREVKDTYTAISLIGTSSLRNIALTRGFAIFCGQNETKIHAEFLRHSISVAASCEELALHSQIEVPPESAVVAGLLHDVGQLWLYCFKQEEYMRVMRDARAASHPYDEMEKMVFGVDHAHIGAWLAESWSLPKSVCSAIQYHHTPEHCLTQPLVPLTHIAEVLSDALELSQYSENRVIKLSAHACSHLNIKWNAESREMFGKIEARSKYLSGFLNPAH
ncbi:MAG: HDOD domain-containing protein [Sideroxydans sp.]|jgi:putative nucleotidyltransferase with HDIG domain